MGITRYAFSDIKLKRRLKACEYSITDIANAVGVTRAAVYLWINCECEPKAGHLLTLSNFIEVPIESFFVRSDVQEAGAES